MVRGCLAVALLLALCGAAAGAQEITNGAVTVRALRDGNRYVGFEVRSGAKPAATVRFSSNRLITAAACTRSRDGRSLLFRPLQTRAGTGLALGSLDTVRVALRPGDPYPAVAFDLRVRAFDAAKWRKAVGPHPFHFLALYMNDAETWHHRGWLNATPLADPFPLLIDPHVGTPEISAYPYNRSWSYTPPLGAHPLPVIGLWAPKARRYAGFEFQTTRLRDNSERDIATGYHWEEAQVASRKAQASPLQFVSLVYPHGGQGYQQLVFPKAGDRIRSEGVLLWNLDMPATADPNRFFFGYLWARAKDRLPRVPPVVDLSWLPGGIRLRDFEGPPPGLLIGGVEGPFQVSGSRVMSGWRWHNESPTQVPARRGDAARMRELEAEAERLLKYAKRFTAGGDACVFWEKPLEGEWTPTWGGPKATSLHNANGFAAGRLFLGLCRDAGKTEYLPIVDGVLNWAKHVAWTRNEFADVPSSPFAIGGTLTASFCLDYYFTFKDSPDARRRNEARRALDLARTFTYRYLALWPSDNNRFDNLDSAFLWEPNSGRDWTGAACSNEVFWNLDTLAQTAVHTGDPVLMWALQGSLARWNLMYQEKYRDSLADYAAGDMTEGYGLYADNVYGLGARAAYGFASPVAMCEPVGNTVVRVLAGEKAAMAFNKEGAHTTIADYRYTPPGNLSFTVRSARRGPFALSLTAPYVDLNGKTVAVVRDGRTTERQPGQGFLRPSQALWSLSVPDVQDGDRVIVGEPDENGPVLPSAIPLASGADTPRPAPGLFVPENLPYDTVPEADWSDLRSWAGLPRGWMWAYGIPFRLAPEGRPAVVTRTITLEKPYAGGMLGLLYSAGDGPQPALICDDGTRIPVDPFYEALAWRAWPPIFENRLIVALGTAVGKVVTGVDPAGRALWAASTLSKKLSPGEEDAEIQRFAMAMKAGSEAWKRVRREEQSIAVLRQEVASLPEGAVALMPPSPGGSAANMLMRARPGNRVATLTPEQLADPASFNAARFPVALYAGGEDYLHTVRSPGDAADNVVRYVREGGTLLLLSMGPHPMYYGRGPAQNPGPLTGRLGLPLYNAIEAVPAEKLTVQVDPGQTILQDVPASFPYPPGDVRLRSIDRTKLPGGARYTPLARVVGATGKGYGDAAGLVQLPGGGRVLYVWGGLMRDPQYGPAITQAALRFMMQAAK